jgi:hypothetical protein
MSTNGMTSWAVDLANVGAIYPLQGMEVLLVVLGLIFWLGWHFLQIRHENADLDKQARSPGEKQEEVETRDLIGLY